MISSHSSILGRLGCSQCQVESLFSNWLCYFWFVIQSPQRIREEPKSQSMWWSCLKAWAVSCKRCWWCFWNKKTSSSRELKSVSCLFSGMSWELVYSGPAMEHVCEGLKPGCSYQTRVYCMSEGGQSPVSHSASVHVRTVTLTVMFWTSWEFAELFVTKSKCCDDFFKLLLRHRFSSLPLCIHLKMTKKCKQIPHHCSQTIDSQLIHTLLFSALAGRV